MKGKTIDKFVMVDIETLNTTTHNPCVIQIGTTFAQRGSSGWTFRNASAFCYPIQRNVDLNTVAWWATQPHFAQILKSAMASELSAANAFYGCLCEVFQSNDATAPDGVYLVANPPTFDLSMLRECYKDISTPFPFHWSKELDYRTAKNLHGDRRKVATEQMIDLGEAGQAHDAEYDALLQARAFTMILDDIR